jgi:hypothetical protein
MGGPRGSTGRSAGRASPWRGVYAAAAESDGRSLGRFPSLSTPLYQLFQTDPTESQKREITDREDHREINSESERARLSRFL